jgi:hypothetical protein
MTKIDADKIIAVLAEQLELVADHPTIDELTLRASYFAILEPVRELIETVAQHHNYISKRVEAALARLAALGEGGE